MKLADAIKLVDRRIKVTNYHGTTIFEGFSAFAERNLEWYLDGLVDGIDAEIVDGNAVVF